MLESAAKVGLIALLAVSVSGCGIRDRLTGNAGNYRVSLPFEARLSTGESNRDFTVAAEAGGASLEDARESLRYPGTAHCIDISGSSEIDWVMDPATGDWQVQRTEEGDLIAQGRCADR